MAYPGGAPVSIVGGRAGGAGAGSATNPFVTSPQPAASTTTPVTGTFAANGNSASFAPAIGRAIWVTLSGTFGGGTVTVQRSVDGGTTWLPLTVGGTAFGTFTAAAQEPVAAEDDAGAVYRLVLTGAAAPSIVYRLGHS